jgi:hypothetical protein
VVDSSTKVGHDRVERVFVVVGVEVGQLCHRVVVGAAETVGHERLGGAQQG